MEDLFYTSITDLRDFNKLNPALNIYNSTGKTDSLYHIKAPFLVTLECCSGNSPQDFVNIITLTANQSFIYKNTFELQHFLFNQYTSHIHDYYELMLVLKGSITQKIEGQPYVYHAGNCCLVNRNLSHAEDFHSEAMVLFIGLSPELIDEIFKTIQSSYFPIEKDLLSSDFYHFIQEDTKKPGQKSYLDFIPAYSNSEYLNFMHSFSEEIIRTLLFPGYGVTYQLKWMICSLLQYLSTSSNYHCTCITLDTRQDFLLFTRIRHLMDESDGRITRTELADRFNYSGDYLNRIVNKYTGLSIFDYGMTFCLKKAAALLSETDMSISDIAAKLHFTNRTHFYMLFKKQYGVTPNTYRKEHEQIHTRPQNAP